jgi:hypothetical protein
MTVKQYIDSLDIADGQTIRSDCPACHGKNTFTVTKEFGHVTYNCFKASCGSKGGINTGMTSSEIKAYMTAKQSSHGKAKPIKDTWVPPEYVVTPSAEHTKFHRFVKRYGISRSSLMYDVKDERAVFPIYEGTKLVDATGRALGDKQPKWYRYTGVADYYLDGTGSTLLVVEDVISAMVAAQEFPYMTAMALLGTSLTDKHIAKAGEYSKVIVALDPDARDKTLQFKREIELWTGLKTVALSLQDDIKYRVPIDIDKLWELQY